MDATRILEADHRDVEDLFDRIGKAKGKERTDLLEELSTSLEAHMTLEEEVVYPHMAKVTGEESVEEGTNEHDVARGILVDIRRLAEDDEPGIGAAIEALEAAITHHVDEEEHDDFPQLRRDGQAQLEAMATPFMQRRLELGLPMTADALSAASSKDELADEAAQAGIEGASSLTKGELAEALAAQMA